MSTFTQEETRALYELRRRVQRGEVSDYYDTWLYRLANFLLDNAGALILYCLALGVSMAMLLAALLLPVW